MTNTTARTTWILGEAFKHVGVCVDIPATLSVPYGTNISIGACQPVDYIVVRYAPFADSEDPSPNHHPKHRCVTCLNCERQGVRVFMYCDQDVQLHAAIHGAVLQKERSK